MFPFSSRFGIRILESKRITALFRLKSVSISTYQMPSKSLVKKISSTETSSEMETKRVTRSLTKNVAKSLASEGSSSSSAGSEPGTKRKRTTLKAETLVDVELSEDNVIDVKGKGKATRKKAAKVKVKKEEQTDEDYVVSESKKKRSKKTTVASKDETERKPKQEMEVIKEFSIPVKTETVKRQAGASPHNGTVDFANKMFIGAHVSAAGGLENSVTNAVEIGAKSFALFLRSQRQWVAKPMEDETVEKFKAACKLHEFSPHLILPHGSYLLNLGSPDEATLAKSRTLLLDELQRCERLGLLYYNIHPGSSCGQISREESIQRIADSINWAHSQMPESRVSVVLENMCRQGHTVGGDLSDLAQVIERVIDQSRVGVCLDTCHALAAGYNIATPEGLESFIEEFDRIIGFQYLVAVHLNDSEGPIGCHRDRHASIGKGHIGIEGFRNIVNCPRFCDIPVILETPYTGPEVYDREISLLNSMIQYSAEK